MIYKIKNLLLETGDTRVDHLSRAVYFTITDSCRPQNDLFIPPPTPPPPQLFFFLYRSKRNKGIET